MVTYFWLSTAQFTRLHPLLPNKVRGVPTPTNRRFQKDTAVDCKWVTCKPLPEGPLHSLINGHEKGHIKGLDCAGRTSNFLILLSYEGYRKGY